MKHFNVTGMSCAACSARVEKAVNGVDGVSSCSVNLLTNSMAVEGTATDSEIISAVQNAGYGASVKGEKPKSDSTLKDTETPKIKARLIFSAVLLLPLMYVSMGSMMWGWPLPQIFTHNHIALGLIQLILTAAIMVANQKFFVSGFKGLIKGSPNMDTLVALGSSAAFLYSTYALFAMTVTDNAGQMALMHEFYFESAAMILTLITVGKMLEARSKGKTTDALKGLMSLAPKTANLVIDGKETTVPVEQVKVGDIFAVRSGESIAADGVVIDGHAAINESAITGESVPDDKTVGDRVTAATVNQSGYILCKAVRVGEDTTLSQIIKTVSDAAATKAPIAKIADRVSGVFVPIVIAIAVITLTVWLICGESVGFSLARAISVLVISCPCALGLATPVAIMVGSGVGAKNGTLFKTAASLEMAGRVKTVVLDKTGTITSGNPTVTDILPENDVTESELLRKAYALEQKSEHPLAKAVVVYCEEKGIARAEIDDFQSHAGNGVSGVIDGNKIVGGSYKFISETAEIGESTKKTAEMLANEGKTPLYFCENGKLIGIIAVCDTIKEDSPDAIKRLKNMGIRVIMLTGDNEKTASAIGQKVGVDEVIAGVLPDGKQAVISKLKENGRVMMVGDGVNDAPALTIADIGVAIGAGTDIAIDAADIVLMKSELSDVPAAISLSKATLRNIKQNLFWAFVYNAVGIPLAAGVWINLFGWTLNPMFGAAAMSLSSVSVVTNALRLNFFKMKDKKMKINKAKEKTKMIIKIEGMMCPHCEAAVKKALEANEAVEIAEVSHVDGTAKVTLKSDVDKSVLEQIITAAGYKVVG